MLRIESPKNKFSHGAKEADAEMNGTNSQKAGKTLVSVCCLGVTTISGVFQWEHELLHFYCVFAVVKGSDTKNVH